MFNSRQTYYSTVLLLVALITSAAAIAEENWPTRPPSEAPASWALVVGGEKDGLVADFPGLAKNVADQLQNSALLLYPNIG